MKKLVPWKRSLACLLMFAVVLAFCVCAMTSFLHAAHDCTGETCAVCRYTALQKQLGKSVPAVCFCSLLMAVPGFCCRISAWGYEPLFCRFSPILAKVKLSD